MTRCGTVVLLVAISAGAALCGPLGVNAEAGDVPRRPNVVLIVADDMGFSDAGCYGGEIQTPNLDQLAQGGLRFTQFYNTARCWPTRACLLTGYYAQQIRRDALPGVKVGGAAARRPDWARLLPEMLRQLGYRCYHSGKWHVDGKVLAGGFDRSYCVEDHDRNFHPKRHTLDDQPLPPVPPGGSYYSTTAIAQYALDMLAEHRDQHRERPFFLYLAFTIPHFPLHALPEDIALYRERYRVGWDVVRQERYERLKKMGLVDCQLAGLDPDVIPRWNLSEKDLREQISPDEVGRAVPWESLSPDQQRFQAEKMAIHAAMIHRMDIEIGRVVERLKSMGVFEDTVIFFLSDNGASAEIINRGDKHDPRAAPGSAGSFLCLGPGWSSAANAPFRLHKCWVHEGGIATPLVVHWPRGIAARGELRHTPSHVIDIPLTILELAGGTWPTEFEGRPLPPTPGKSLVPTFAKNVQALHEHLWWFHEGNRAIRIGDWKLASVADGPWELYDLKADRSETKNLASDHPDRVRELEAAWNRLAEEFRALATKDLPPDEAAGKLKPGKPKRKPSQPKGS